MNYRRLNLALIMAVVAVVLQTTLFVELRPLGVAPDFVLLVVVACALYLSDEGVMVLGFAAGLLNDLLGNTLLGVWALVLTVVAFVAARARFRVEGSLPAMAIGVLVITFMGEMLFVVVGTLFGQDIFSDTQVLRKVVLASFYNLILAPLVIFISARVLQGRARPNEGVWA